MGVQKPSHHCALNLWKGSGREPGEDKEGFWIWVEHPDCDWKACEDSILPSLRAESQVNSGRKYHPAITNRHRVAKGESL